MWRKSKLCERTCYQISQVLLVVVVIYVGAVFVFSKKKNQERFGKRLVYLHHWVTQIPLKPYYSSPINFDISCIRFKIFSAVCWKSNLELVTIILQSDNSFRLILFRFATTKGLKHVARSFLTLLELQIQHYFKFAW